MVPRPHTTGPAHDSGIALLRMLSMLMIELSQLLTRNMVVGDRDLVRVPVEEIPVEHDDEDCLYMQTEMQVKATGTARKRWDDCIEWLRRRIGRLLQLVFKVYKASILVL